MAFTLAQLRLVLAIHEHGSLGKSGLALNLTQPAMSRNLRELERQLGAVLFERHPSGLRPTRFCHAILPYAENIIREADQVLEEVRVMAGESRQAIRIGALPRVAATILPTVIDQLIADIPNICVEVVEGIGEVLIDGLKSHEMDIIVSPPIPADNEIVMAIDLGFEDVCTLLVGADHPLRHSAELPAEEFIDQQWVTLPRGSLLRKTLEQRLLNQGLPLPRIQVETRSVNLVRKLVAEHGFVTWGPAPLYGSADRDPPIIALDRPEFSVRLPFNVYRLRRAVMSSAVRRALAIFQRIASEHARAGTDTDMQEA